MHLVYIGLLLVVIFGFFFFWAIYEFFKTKKYPRSINYLFPIIIFSFAPILFIKIIDKYGNLRGGGAQGYNWIDWKLNFSALFTSYPHNNIKFPFEYINPIHYESDAFLGNFALFSALILVIVYVFKKRWFISLKKIFTSDKGFFLLLILASALVSLLISLGETIIIFNDSYKITNYLNPFYYIHKITDLVTHFRCLARFNWIFFWGFNFFIAFIIDHYVKYYKSFFVNSIVLGLIFCAIIATKETIMMFKINEYKNYLTDKSYTEKLIFLVKSVDFSKYQAILPIPFYHVGSENYDYTIDPDEPFCTQTMQLSLMSNLPLMSSKMSRTADYQVKELFKLFTEDDIPDDLFKLLTDKPLLVLYNKQVHNEMMENYTSNQYPRCREVIFKNADIIKKYNMELLSKYQDIYLYHFEVGDIKK
ncbi:MAG: hypothetical protein FVQ77_15190 [Cytophagales bacterium]|nr:hypothetical protein [Cytophagales bacterium]